MKQFFFVLRFFRSLCNHFFFFILCLVWFILDFFSYRTCTGETFHTRRNSREGIQTKAPTKACAIENRITNQSVVFTTFFSDRHFFGVWGQKIVFFMQIPKKKTFHVAISSFSHSNFILRISPCRPQQKKERKIPLDIYYCSIISTFLIKVFDAYLSYFVLIYFFYSKAHWTVKR